LDDELRAAAADFRGALARLDHELAGASAEVDAERAARPAAAARVDANCKALLAVLRKRCPALLPELGVPPGAPVEPVPVPADSAVALIAVALRQQVAAAATGRTPPPDAQLPTVALWQEGADALLVEVASCKIELGVGEVTVHLPVRCDQLPNFVGHVTVRILVGTADRPTGLFAATGERPEGPAVVVQRWGDALTALVWQAVLDVAHSVARHAGTDSDGAALVPVAIVAARAGLVVLPQARHSIDRIVRGVDGVVRG
jgi:hypothetical protein